MDDFKVSVINKDFSISVVTLPGSSYGRTAEYPSKWFSDNPGTKPTVVHYNKPGASNSWPKMLGHCLHTLVQPHVAVIFMIDYINQHFKANLAQDWSSYNVRIASAQTEVTPMSIIAARSNGITVTASEGDEIQESEKHRLFYMLIAGYRFGLASEMLQGDYKSTILGKINQVLKNNPYNLNTDLTPTEMSKCKAWYNNVEFRKLIAALDMFWAKFPESHSAKLRVCTLNARFKDCSIISEIHHLSVVSGREFNDILQYIFSVRVRDEIIKLGKDGEEMQQEDSYFPYMKELGLSKRSPYSTTENIHLHNWISIFCTLLGSDRFFNARVVSENGLLVSLNLAIFAAYAFRMYSSHQFAYADDFAGVKAIRKMEKDGEESDPAFDPLSPMGVFKHMSDNSNSVPHEVKQVFSTLINKMGPPRDKTIGAFLKKNLA